jgi:hypothetical protein
MGFTEGAMEGRVAGRPVCLDKAAAQQTSEGNRAQSGASNPRKVGLR